MTGSHHERLAEYMEQRRLELGLSWKEVAQQADSSEATLRAVRNGTNQPSPLTRRGIDNALRWKSGSVDAILAGGEPTVREQRVPIGQAVENDSAGPATPGHEQPVEEMDISELRALLRRVDGALARYEDREQNETG